jgi:hypothetical protein
MTKRRKIASWVALVLSLPAAGYAGKSVIFYAWLNAAEPERWPAERAAVWVYSSLALTVLFFAIFIYCIVSLVRDANKTYEKERNAT